ncbi:bromodomain protein, putative [Babesia caballi]|uniref:Bromodomain protein, putative n=1 Tax=Babesia caballi TaxID=5871 RepID=A0AAV4LM71_BABCB|nr:bromodomain protein, putative [Babesia caballi]
MRGSASSQGNGPGGTSHGTKRLGLSLERLDSNGVAMRLKEVYAETLRKLIAFDKEGAFSSPADSCGLIEYEPPVRKPMDFDMMRQKMAEMYYLDDPSHFDEDIALTLHNMRAYNHESSARYLAAVKLEEAYGWLRPHMVKRISDVLEAGNKKSLNNVNRARAEVCLSLNDVTPVSTGTSERYAYLDPTSATKRRRYRKVTVSDAPSSGKPRSRLRYKINPIIYAVNQTMLSDPRAYEPVGVCLGAPGGLNRVLKAIEGMYARLLETPYASMSWFDIFMEPYRRILRDFEYLKHSSHIRGNQSVDARAGSLVMRRLKPESYKDTILKFVGEDNLKRVNVLFPSLMDTLSDLHVNPHLIVTRADLKF